MATTLTEYLKDNPPGEFRSVPHYFPSGDFLTYFVSDEPCVAKRIDDVVTVYLACGTERLVGCKVKGVKHILRTAGEFRVAVEDGSVRLGFFFFVSASPDRAGVDRRWFELLKPFADVRIPREAFEPIACA